MLMSFLLRHCHAWPGDAGVTPTVTRYGQRCDFHASLLSFHDLDGLRDTPLLSVILLVLDVSRQCALSVVNVAIVNLIRCCRPWNHVVDNPADGHRRADAGRGAQRFALIVRLILTQGAGIHIPGTSTLRTRLLGMESIVRRFRERPPQGPLERSRAT